MAHSSTVALVAYDTGPCLAFDQIAHALGSRAIPLLAYSGRKMLSGTDLKEVLYPADVVLVGMSSLPNNDIELKAMDAAYTLGKPIIGFADTFGAWNRKAFLDHKKWLSGMCICTELELKKATEAYASTGTEGDVPIFVTGNPAWDTFLKTARLREDLLEEMGLTDKHRVIFISGTKKGERVNVPMLEMTLKAAALLVREYRQENWSGNPKPVVVFGLHPGDKTDRALYDEVVSRFPTVPFRYLKGLSGDDVVPMMDVLVIPGAGSLALHAIVRGHGGIRIIDCPFEGIDAYLTNEGVLSGMSLAGLDLSYRPVSFDDYVEALSRGITHTDVSSLTALEDLTNLQIGQAAKKIIAVLEKH